MRVCVGRWWLWEARSAREREEGAEYEREREKGKRGREREGGGERKEREREEVERRKREREFYWQDRDHPEVRMWAVPTDVRGMDVEWMKRRFSEGARGGKNLADFEKEIEKERRVSVREREKGEREIEIMSSTSKKGGRWSEKKGGESELRVRSHSKERRATPLSPPSQHISQFSVTSGRPERERENEEMWERERERKRKRERESRMEKEREGDKRNEVSKEEGVCEKKKYGILRNFREDSLQRVRNDPTVKYSFAERKGEREELGKREEKGEGGGEREGKGVRFVFGERKGEREERKGYVKPSLERDVVKEEKRERELEREGAGKLDNHKENAQYEGRDKKSVCKDKNEVNGEEREEGDMKESNERGRGLGERKRKRLSDSEGNLPRKRWESESQSVDRPSNERIFAKKGESQIISDDSDVTLSPHDRSLHISCHSDVSSLPFKDNRAHALSFSPSPPPYSASLSLSLSPTLTFPTPPTATPSVSLFDSRLSLSSSLSPSSPLSFSPLSPMGSLPLSLSPIPHLAASQRHSPSLPLSPLSHSLPLPPPPSPLSSLQIQI